MTDEAFARAVTEARQQVAHFERRVKQPMGHGAKGTLRAARIALAALLLCQEFGMQAVVIARAQRAEQDAEAGEWAAS